MDKEELKYIVGKVNELQESNECPKVEYMMDFGSVAILTNFSLN